MWQKVAKFKGAKYFRKALYKEYSIYLYGLLFTCASAISLARMVSPDLASSCLPSIFENMYFHC